MAEPTCHYCNRPAEEECPACGRLYCGEHGEDVCIRCLSPESAIPSATVFRGSLVALVVATIVALFLWIDPPHTGSGGAVVATISPLATQPAATATPTPSSVASSAASPTPSASPSPPPTAAATAPATAAASSPTSAPTSAHTYTIVSGDTLETIASAHNTTPAQIEALNPGLNPNLLPGTVINLP